MALKNSLFTVISIITTTGFSTENFNQLPVFSKTILILLMFIGGMAGSTAGGLKVSRVAIGIKSAVAEYKRMLYHNQTYSVVFDYGFLDISLYSLIDS